MNYDRFSAFTTAIGERLPKDIISIILLHAGQSKKDFADKIEGLKMDLYDCRECTDYIKRKHHEKIQDERFLWGYLARKRDDGWGPVQHLYHEMKYNELKARVYAAHQLYKDECRQHAAEIQGMKDEIQKVGEEYKEFVKKHS